MKSSEIRQAFLNYFVQRGHQLVASSSLIPSNDPTLLFTNAGMVQFKDLFLGLETRPYQRAVTAQRCVRAGGKHNDLENVGYTARHHTFFEMLGNFSFGDYFKREAIQYAWEFLTEVLHIPAERLWVTVYKEDLEAEGIWLKEMKVSPERFSRCGEKDNFWSMGDTGPCGPCTEIFYDHGPEVAGGPPGSPDEDGDRYIEIWNLVFMQFNRDREGCLHPLPKPSVDTGMGLERLAAVIQGVHSNYEIDSFQYLIKAIAQLGQDIDLNHTSLKVIADHIRSCSFLIVDGVLPSNEGRGYVLRRIIRRAVRHGNKLGLPSPFFFKLVQPLIDVMGDAYPELINSKAHIERILQQEENQFTRTLEQGLRLLQDHIKNLKGQELSGEVAFKLYDTYGFPIDLTADIIREQGLHIDMEAFNQLMQQQREQSQAASQFTTDYHAVSQLDHQSEFHGYEKESMEAKIIGLLQEGNEVKSLNKGAKGAVILDHTPFYAESGGQVGDKGLLIGKEFSFQVDDTQKVGQAVVHYGEVIKGELTLDLSIHAQVDHIRRDAIRLNHTATHLLHAALKQIVGQHVQQRGSLVDAERARFDFSHFEPLTPQQIQQIEEVVNAQIRANNEVITQVMDIESAKQSGAVALFGEKYSDAVRVLSMGDFSKELCGGTHARRTGDIGLFKIVAEYGIASGIRRVEMVTGRYALAWVNEQLGFMNNLAATLKTTPNSLQEKVSQLLLDNKNQEKMIAKLLSEKAQKSGADILGEIEEIKGINLLIKQLEGMDSQTMRHTMDQLKSRIDSAVIILFTIEQNKMNVIAGVSKNIIGKTPNAAQLVRHLCGKGGGRDDMAQGGGDVPEDLNSKIKEIKEMIEKN
ncbi:TPA: alanine--tRNA ligase [Legionella pneumophila]|uniref:Alanine--tRNA ligase n=1 Tax=Legionella pneumophila (strain Lens) TaxID=297245 RepID=SYA_LEGPL|nr:alanine--tRNA ligase [Legionella pneumophila]Q5WVQ2.1 RecName: Full=Alanine--tRNA ligase; AltName: Full=Alanyl-tRNA synthetase; Short=AlaRS [Legionella pneumophila str. Lens]AOW51678.1 alanine--tRNA ligase [Legionella pneumophila subsp. pneumophila]AOW54728.1 alanine--tRNA ligase [Legionella pneumophila subsp. pneumophila]AOW65184.1 alanine--tRNA ligase [Legionella pneumophila subsp. pneumophila]RYW92433.1 alanine--tRNA ligase [Legionella pneumophila]CAH16002.1 alanyl-tRNA synthetase [Legi